MTFLLMPGLVATSNNEAVNALLADIAEAIRRAYPKQAAACIDIWGKDGHEAELSHALSGRRSLNVAWLASLSPRFWFHFLRLRAKRIGSDVIEPGVMADLVAKVNQLVESAKGRVA
jgi:hypothetical protein